MFDLTTTQVVHVSAMIGIPGVLIGILPLTLGVTLARILHRSASHALLANVITAVGFFLLACIQFLLINDTVAETHAWLVAHPESHFRGEGLFALWQLDVWLFAIPAISLALVVSALHDVIKDR
jgi:hypothetical protein